MTHRIRTDPNRLPTDHYDGYTPSRVSPGYERPKATKRNTAPFIILAVVIVALYALLAIAALVAILTW